jgi:uncharacterized protein (TIGR01777 family)
MTAALVILAVQALLGAFDNLWHHELQARLPRRASARRELALHAAREAIYAVVFAGLGWLEWHGVFAWALAVLLLAELAITLADFVEEDRARRLPPFERVLHTLLTIGYGLFLGTLAPVLARWAALPSGFAPAPRGAPSVLFTLFAAGVGAWAVRNVLAVAALGRPPARGASSAPAGAPQDARIAPAVLVTGATGFVGRALVARLVGERRRVVVLARDLVQARANFGPGVWVVDRLDAIPPETRLDAIVHLAGARVLGRPWTAARRRLLLASRVDTTVALVALMRRLRQPPRVLVAASAVGFYGARAGSAAQPLDESAPPCAGQFQSDLCAAIEHEARRAEALGVRVVRLRLGVVLGREDGAYPMLALAARCGLGAVLGSGAQAAPWIHLDDAVGLACRALDDDALAGAVNAVAPETPAQARFAQALAASFGRRVRLRVPHAPMRRLLGEMAELLLEGQHVAAAAALRAGYGFRFPTLEAALADLAAAPAGARPAGDGGAAAVDSGRILHRAPASRP